MTARRRLLRITGTLLAAGGVLMLVWVVVVWRWQDPFTALYTSWKQHQLATSYERRARAYHAPRVEKATPVSVTAGRIRAVARRYRLDTKRGQAIGRIKVPRLGLNMVLVDGTDHDSLTKGPGLDRRTYMPGEGQLVYIAGHRTTYLAPFRHIDELDPGDQIRIEMPYAAFTYTMSRHEVVDPGDVGIIKPIGFDQLVLTSCHPPYSAAHRYAVFAKLTRIDLFAIGGEGRRPPP